ncbi:MAG: metal-dependent hydrolase [Myxococcota bacterium]
MDPVSQAVLGGGFAGTWARRRAELRPAVVAGVVGGMLPDLDVVIRSKTDPLLFLEYHRQFTHSLLFIPIGGLVAAVALWPVLRRRLSLRRIYGYATAGYATHAMLDSCTSYGTQLLWPFSDLRVAWNTISIIDPLYTLPFLALVVLAFWYRSRALLAAAFVLSTAYLLFGWMQHERAQGAARRLAEKRGHAPKRLFVKPSFANVVLWKSLYEADDEYHVDAIRVGLDTRYYPGESVRKFDATRDLPWLKEGSRQKNDLERFRWFSDGYLVLDPRQPNSVGDVRYSLLPNRVAPLWVIRFDPDSPDEHVRFENQRAGARSSLAELSRMLSGDGALPVEPP